MVERIYHESDLTQQAIMDEDRLAQAVVSGHSAVEDELPRRLDIDVEEIDLIKGASIKAVVVEIRRRSDLQAEPERLIVPEAAFDKLAKGRKMAEILTEAAPVVVEPVRQTSRRDRMDYTAEGNFGISHQGKVSPAEAARVRGDLTGANQNRARVGQPPINPEDEGDRRKYGFDGSMETSAQESPVDSPATV